MKRYRILFIERYRTVEARVLPALLQHYDVELVHGRREAMGTLEQHVPDLILVDVPSIRFDLERFCEDIKQRQIGISFFFLLGKGMRLDRLPRAHGFLRHEFTIRQLLNRLERILPEQTGELITWKGLQLNCTTNSLAWETEEIFLTPKQAALARVFINAPEALLSRAQLMQDVWGTDYLGDTRTLDVHIHWLRKALRSLKAPFCLETVRGRGYRLLVEKG